MLTAALRPAAGACTPPAHQRCAPAVIGCPICVCLIRQQCPFGHSVGARYGRACVCAQKTESSVGGRPRCSPRSRPPRRTTRNSGHRSAPTPYKRAHCSTARAIAVNRHRRPRRHLRSEGHRNCPLRIRHDSSYVLRFCLSLWRKDRLTYASISEAP